MKPQIVIDGEQMAGRHPWAFTILYIAGIAMACSLFRSLTGIDLPPSGVIAIAAFEMAVEARYGVKAND